MALTFCIQQINIASGNIWTTNDDIIENDHLNVSLWKGINDKGKGIMSYVSFSTQAYAKAPNIPIFATPAVRFTS